MKKLICAALSAAMLFASAVVPASADTDEISVLVDNEEVMFEDQSPTIINNRTLVPIRAVFEKAGAEVSWDGANLVASVEMGNYTIRISPNSEVMYKNGKAVQLDVPSEIINNRILIPVRAIAEAMDFDVSWNGYLKTVLIATDGIEYRSFAGVKRGFRDIKDIADLYLSDAGTGYSDLDGDGSLDAVSFTPMNENEGQDGVVLINGVDYSGAVSSMSSVSAVASVNINKDSATRELVMIESGDVNIAHFFTFNGEVLTECTYTKPVRFSKKLLFDEKKYILSDLHGFLFTDIMVTGSYFEFDDSNLGYFRTNAKVREVAPRQLSNIYDDGMLYKMVVTDKYIEGAYKGVVEFEKVYSQTFETFTLLNIYVDNEDPEYFEFYIEMADGTRAVIMPYSA